MDISLREWLIIGGILIVILILVDGWRRVSANRGRLRLDIDSTLSDLPDEDSSHNPELPNGGARLRDHEGRPLEDRPRVEPGFAEDTYADRGESQNLQEMDPLFDDIPPTVGTAPRRAAFEVTSGHAAAPESAAVVTDSRDVPVETEPEQPIPVLKDEVVPSDAREERADSCQQPVVGGETQHWAEQAEVAVDHHGRFDDLAEAADMRPAPEDSAHGHQPEVELPEPEYREPEPEAVKPVEELRPERDDDWHPALQETAVVTDAMEPAAVRGPRSLPDPENVLIITVVGHNGEQLSGPVLGRIVTACGMEWGEMAIYHRPEDNTPDSPIQFSMANAVAPGTFDPHNLEALETPAVTFFMSMDEPSDAMTAYECMLATAETLAKHLKGDLLDEDRSVMRPQTKEHYRERIRDYEMHKRQRRAN
ncbi:cell division protein ZipA [Marinobacterium marinum]|uniref:Cell division protein ZipA n=1 Tax=Marinobacterium marinum TaxID=2756129 RepID=A0A7W2A9R5_9GAMM|nr:cell division protein ZipA [Marinobacterium marinum]MBA4501026.1 cell division protein ZipA [Marinobacterium marinum]